MLIFFFFIQYVLRNWATKTIPKNDKKNHWEAGDLVTLTSTRVYTVTSHLRMKNSEFYKKTWVLYNVRSSIQCLEFYTMPRVLHNSRSSMQNPRFLYNARSSIQNPEYLEPIGLISEKKSFSLNSPFKSGKSNLIPKPPVLPYYKVSNPSPHSHF